MAVYASIVLSEERVSEAGTLTVIGNEDVASLRG